MGYDPELVAVSDFYLMMGAIIFFAASIMILVIYESKLLRIREYKEKYDYVILHEIQYFSYSVKVAMVALALYCNTVMTEWIMRKGWDWFLGRLFLTAGVTIVIYSMLASLIRIYYPTYMEKRLERLRNRPRVSPAGNPMRKLSETEEDVHLEADQIAEEGSAVHSVDYDVWLDEKTGQKKIEKYFNYHHVVECPNCGYVTMKIHNEEVTIPPTLTEQGELTKHYRCTFCKHRERQTVQLAKLSENVA